MQKKIPFGATIAYAFNFTFSYFVTIALLVWAPLLLMSVGSLFAVGITRDFMAALQANAPSAWSHVAGLVPAYAVGVVLACMIFTTISEYALGQRQPSLFSWPIGKPVWRVIGAFFLIVVLLGFALMVATLGVVLVGLLLGSLLAVLMPNGAESATTLAGAVAILFVQGALFYAAVRLFFLVVPLTLISQRIDLAGAWRLTKGNFWRIFGIILVIFLPLLIVEYALIFVAVGFPPMDPSLSEEARSQAELAWNIAMFDAMTTYWYVALPLILVMSVYTYGTFAGAQAFAYRAVTEGDSAPVTGDSLPDR